MPASAGTKDAVPEKVSLRTARGPSTWRQLNAFMTPSSWLREPTRTKLSPIAPAWSTTMWATGGRFTIGSVTRSSGSSSPVRSSGRTSGPAVMGESPVWLPTEGLEPSLSSRLFSAWIISSRVASSLFLASSSLIRPLLTASRRLRWTPKFGQVAKRESRS